MKITVETNAEAIALAIALMGYTKTGLIQAGALVQRKNEDPWYTAQREFLRALEKFIERR
jgi:hypothetical protein